MNERRCLSCGTHFYSEQFFISKCNICQQTDAMEEQHRLNRQQARELNEANARQAAEHAHILAQAEYARVQAEYDKISAIQEQTRAIKESVITPKEAYDRGYNYIDKEWQNGNPCSFIIWIFECGKELFTWWNPPYIIPTLNEKFNEGFNAKLNPITFNAYKTLKDSAYNAGKRNAYGTLPTRFGLHTGVEINGVEIGTMAFESNLTSTTDEDTGEITFNWNPPFIDKNLNDEYKKGVQEVQEELNAPDKKKQRLINEIAEIKAQREAIRKQQEQDEIDDNKDTNFAIACIALLWICPFVGLYFVWELTTGWTTFFSFIVGIVASLFIVVSYNQWHDDNKLRFSYPILEKVYRTFLYLGPFVGGYFVWTVFSGWTSLVFFTIMLIAFCVGHILNGEDWVG